jgi:hypothetical protein
MRLYARPGTLELETGECELLAVATARWTDVAGFGDDQVAQVKAIFRRGFDLPLETVLVGSAFPDGIVLQDPGNSQVFYAVWTGIEEGTWEGAKLDCEEGQLMAWLPGLRIRQVMTLMAESEDMGLNVVEP